MHNLNLTINYCSHWHVNEAMRELIANTIDEGGEIKSSPEEVTFITNSALPLKAFVMGYSNKQIENPIGQFGEGLKLAILVLLREGINFAIQIQSVNSSAVNEEIVFEFVNEPPFNIPILHMSYPNLPEDLEYKTVITVATDTPAVGRAVRKMYLDSSTLESSLVSTSLGDIVPNKAGVYLNGFRIFEYSLISYRNEECAINLHSNVDLNRERTVTRFDILDVIVEFLEDALPPEALLDSDFDLEYDRYMLYGAFSEEYTKKVKKMYYMKAFPNSTITNERIIIKPSGKRYKLRPNDNILLLDVNKIDYSGLRLNRSDDSTILRQLEYQYKEHLEDNKVKWYLDKLDRIKTIDQFISFLLLTMNVDSTIKKKVYEVKRRLGIKARALRKPDNHEE